MNTKRICYIDDNMSSVDAIMQLLKEAGYEVDHYTDTRIALAAFFKHDYCLLIADLALATGSAANGNGLVTLIRQSDEPIKSNIPIILVAASASFISSTTKEAAVQLGADLLLRQPLEGHQLRQSIKALISQKTAQQSAEVPVLEDAPVVAPVVTPVVNSVAKDSPVIKPIGISLNIPILTEVIDSETGFTEILDEKSYRDSISESIKSGPDAPSQPKTKAVTKVKVNQERAVVLPIAARISPVFPGEPDMPTAEVVKSSVRQTEVVRNADKVGSVVLSSLDKMPLESAEYDRNNLFKSRSVFASKSFKLIMWLVLFFGLLLSAAGYWYVTQQQLVVAVTAVSKGPLVAEITAPGRVISQRKINLSALRSGQVTELAVREGDTVKKGQVLIQLDDKEAQNKVSRIEANLRRVQEQVALADKMLRRLQAESKAGAISQQRVDNAASGWKAGTAKLGEIKAELKSAKLQLRRLQVKAPFDGIVTSIMVHAGEWVERLAPILNIADISQMKAEIDVDVSDSGNLTIGQSVLLVSNTLAAESWSEKITKISSQATRDGSENIIKVLTSLDNGPVELRIGQQVAAQLRTETRSHALQVPFKVVFGQGDRPYVGIIENAQVRLVPVVLGIEGNSMVEIIEGLRVGQQVIIPSDTPLKQGMAVVVGAVTK